MKTLLRRTTPADAFDMFKATFDKKNLPEQLDNSFIAFTNCMSYLRTDCIRTIITYTNQEIKPTHLDVLAICHLFQHPLVLESMLKEYEEEVSTHYLNIKKAKFNREITNDIFQNDLNQAYSQSIAKYEALYKKATNNVYLVKSMISLINLIKKQN